MDMDMKTIAQKTASAGWAPVALYGVSKDGQFCHCPKGGRCSSKGKHPIETEWASKPFPSDADIEALWSKHKSAQMGIRTGSISGNLVVLDIDTGGKEALAPLVRAGGGMPETLVVQTGSGGMHYYFTAPAGVTVPNSQGKVAAHVDIRGEGGQVVGPFARTDKGSYAVLHNAAVAPMPQWLLDVAAAPREQVEYIPAAAVKRPQTAEEASYERNLLNKQLSRLAALQNKPWEQGDAWDQNCFEVACHLVELANSEWAAITHEQAREAYLSAAPSDAQWDERMAKWMQAMNTCGSKAKEGPSGSVVEAAPRQAGPDFPQGAQAPTVAPAPAPASLQRTNSDATMVDEFARAVLEGRAAYIAETRKWRTYAEGVWGPSSPQAIREMFRVYILGQLAEAAADGDDVRTKLLLTYTQGGKIKTIAELCEGRMLVSVDEFDQCRDLIVVGNGTVDLSTGTLGPHDPEHRFTRRTKVHFVPGASHPDVTEMLQALPEGTEEWMQIRFGQALTGHPTWDDVMPILQGGGSNGKSSIIVGLQKALGEYMGMVSERTLLSRDGDHPTELADLRGMRVAVIEELPQEGVLNVKRLKDTLGTATIRARKIREDTIEWAATHSLFLTTNYIPRVTETDHGTWRRLALVRFPFHYIKPHESLRAPEDRYGDPGLRHRLEAGEQGQHEAILAWVIEGARKWYAIRRADLPVPDVVARDTSTWRTEADKIWGFLADRMEFDTSSQVLSTELFAEFSAYLQRIGAANWSDQTFAIRLKEHHLAREHGIEKVRTSRLEGLSRPGSAYQTFADGQKTMVWRGLRFAEQGQSGSVTNLADWRN